MEKVLLQKRAQDLKLPSIVVERKDIVHVH